MKRKDFIQEIFKDKRSVFSFVEIAMLLDESDAGRLRQRVSYYCKRGVLLNIRRGIYAKQGYNPEEAACKIYTPSYLSLEYVLQKAGIIFQYSSSLTAVSYLSRTIEVGPTVITYRKIKNELLVDVRGIIRHDNGINMASPERAVLDMLYLNKEYYFDNLAAVDQSKIMALLPVYQSMPLENRISRLMRSI